MEIGAAATNGDLLLAFSPQQLAAARAGRTWPMLAVKEALRGLPLQEAFAAFARVVGLPPSPGPDRKPLTSLRAMATSARNAYFEIDPGGEAYENRPPRVIGTGDQRLLSNVQRPLYVSRYDTVAVRGRSQLVEWPDAVGFDQEPWEFGRIDDDIELDSAILRRDGDAAWILPARGETLRLDAAFSLLGPNSFAFGHWLAEYLPRLWLALESPHLPQVPVLIDAGMPSQHRQALEMLAPGHPVVEVAPMQRVEVGRLWHAPACYYAPMYPQFNARMRYDYLAANPEVFAHLFAGMSTRFGLDSDDMPGVGERIYLARKPGSHRKLVNREEIEAVAEAAGYRCVYLEDLPFAEQLALVRRADRLTGPEGSAFFLGFFARPGTCACILNHPHTEYLSTVTALLEATGSDCTVLTGPYRSLPEDGYLHFADYEIDPAAFADFLANW